MSETFDVTWEDNSPETVVEKLAELESVLEDRLVEAMETAVIIVESSAKKFRAGRHWPVAVINRFGGRSDR